MKKRFKPSAITLLLALALPWGGASAEDGGATYYLGLQGGRHTLKSWDGEVSFGAGVSLPGRANLDQGLQGGLIAGRQTEHARYEIEYQRGNFDLQSIQLGPLTEDVGGAGRYEALTLNAYRTEHLTGQVSGYLGAGIGFGRSKLPDASFSSGCHCFRGASGDGMAYQLRAGLEYGQDSPHKAFVQYTFLSLPGANSGGTPGVDYDRKQIGIIGIGYRYVFR